MSNKTKNIEGLVPIILFSISSVIWIILAYFKLANYEGNIKLAGIIIVSIYILWLLLESKVAIKEPDKGITKRDKGTLEFYAFGRILTVTAALALHTGWSEFGIIPIIGFSLTVFGIIFRLNAIRTLGKFYSHRVRKVNEHKIISSGIYKYIRHPAYTGMIIANIGFVIFFYHYIALALLIIIFIPAIIIRILVEEKMLFEIEGYKEYSKNRARLFPFIW